MNEPEWTQEKRKHNTPYSDRWQFRSEEQLIGNLRGRIVYGYLHKGGKHSPGWFVTQYPNPMGEFIARLNPNLTLDEAQQAAKLLLLAQHRSKR